MKHFFAALAAFLLCISLFAQTKMAIKGGYNYSTARAYFTEIKQGTGFKSGGGLGILFKADFDGVLHFSPSIMVNQRGYSIKPLSGSIKKYDNTITYLDLYPGLSLDFPIKGNEEKTFVVGFGPQISFAATGTEKTTDAAGVITKSKMKFSTTGNYGVGDIGMNASIGIQINKLMVEAKYCHGLASINNEEEFDGRNIRNRMFSLNIGYFFK